MVNTLLFFSIFFIITNSDYQNKQNYEMTIKENQVFIFSPLHPRLFSIFYTIRLYSSSIISQDFVPEKYYSNADILKEEILKENKGKSGIYR